MTTLLFVSCFSIKFKQKGCSGKFLTAMFELRAQKKQSKAHTHTTPKHSFFTLSINTVLLNYHNMNQETEIVNNLKNIMIKETGTVNNDILTHYLETKNKPPYCHVWSVLFMLIWIGCAFIYVIEFSVDSTVGRALIGACYN
jgi:hypothetical protein